LTTKVPIWTALILSFALAYFVTRSDPQPQTVIEYRDIQAPAVTTTLAPEQITVYQEVTELRIDTIYVPINYTRYELWKPSEVQQRNNSVVVRSFDLDTSTYRDYQFKPVEAKFGVNLNVSAMSSVFSYQPILEVEALARYRRVAIVGRVGIGDELYAIGGVRYVIK
jgi:serine/threonine protein kinase HipA of HipAB toxin-antitoxin module